MGYSGSSSHMTCYSGSFSHMNKWGVTIYYAKNLRIHSHCATYTYDDLFRIYVILYLVLYITSILHCI